MPLFRFLDGIMLWAVCGPIEYRLANWALVSGDLSILLWTHFVTNQKMQILYIKKIIQ